MMADLDAECACGRAFPDEAAITAHILETFPPHASQLLDGRYHAGISESWPHIRGYHDQYGQPPPRTTHAKCRQMYTDVTQMLTHRPTSARTWPTDWRA
jgi:hypothetical protein